MQTYINPDGERHSAESFDITLSECGRFSVPKGYWTLDVYEPTKLSLWTLPDCYFGDCYPATYVFPYGQNRDSDCLERSNFDAACKQLLALADDDDVWIVRENHWAVGWIEWVAISQDNSAALRLADEICTSLEDYPVLDEGLYSEYEDEECSQVWSNCFDERDRLDYLQSHTNFWDYIDDGWTTAKKVCQAIKGDWGYASQLLPCPSGLIY